VKTNKRLIVGVGWLVIVAAGAGVGLAGDHPADQRAGQKPPAGCICETGQRQSPIDLVDAEAAELPRIAFDYDRTVHAEVFDTGYTVEVEFGDEGRPGIDIRGERFELLQLHFHRPSEHLEAGKGEPLEMHFVHRNQAGELAVVGVFLDAQEGEPQPVIETIWTTVPEQVGQRAPIDIAPAGLLPADRSYYRYAGSLTTEPCAEGVRWHVLRGRLTVSPGQVEAYRHPDTARPVQPLDDRPLLVGG
jgi:carbonic anhydrase